MQGGDLYLPPDIENNKVVSGKAQVTLSFFWERGAPEWTLGSHCLRASGQACDGENLRPSRGVVRVRVQCVCGCRDCVRAWRARGAAGCGWWMSTCGLRVCGGGLQPVGGGCREGAETAVCAVRVSAEKRFLGKRAAGLRARSRALQGRVRRSWRSARGGTRRVYAGGTGGAMRVCAARVPHSSQGHLREAAAEPVSG